MDVLKLKQTLSGVCLLAAGVVIGRWSAASPGTEGEAQAAAPAGTAARQAAGFRPSGHARTAGQTVDADGAWLAGMDGPERAAALEEKARGVLFEADPARRLVLFATLLEHLEPGDYDTIVKAFAFHDQQGRFFYPEFEFFCATAGRVDGRAVMDNIFKNSETANNSAAKDKVMAAWAGAEPAAAIGWWNQQPEGALRDSLAKSLISGLVKKDFGLAWSCLNSFPAEDQPRFMGDLVRQKIAEGGFEASSEWLLSLPGKEADPLKQKGFESMYNAMPNLDPAKKARQLERFLAEPWMARSHFPVETAAQWAEKDGPGASAWAAGLPQDLRERALPAALGKWAVKDTAAAAGWFRGNPGNADVQGRRALIGAIISARDPERAKAWLEATAP